MKFFNTAGPVNQEEHYKLDPLHRWDLDDILLHIAKKEYFVLHAPRQTGKTSCLVALCDYLNGSDNGDHKAIYLNVESAQIARNDVDRGIAIILDELSGRIEDHLLSDKIMTITDRYSGGSALSQALRCLCESYKKPLVLFIDEIDSLIGDTLISALRQLRTGYIDRPHRFPVSIILCGVRDIRDYRIQRSNMEIITGGSCFNISVESLRLSNFSREDVKMLLMQHTDYTGQKFEDSVFDYIFDQTDGQPWLVNAIADTVTSKMKENRDPKVLITLDKVKDAVNRVILSRAVHLDQLADKLKEDRVRRVLLPMILGESEGESTADDQEYCIDLGLIKKTSKGLVVSNPIYNEIVPRELTESRQTNFISRFNPDWINIDGSLNTDTLFQMFVDFWRTNSEVWGTQIKGYVEAAPHLVFQAFLQRVANSDGIVKREYALGRKRLDLFLEWKPSKIKDINAEPSASENINVIHAVPPDQRVIIELKILRKNEKYETVKKLAIKQTIEYSDKCNGTEEHIIIFDRDETRGWREKVFTDVGEWNNRTIKIWGC